jgi:ATP-binding cassette subfamily C protein
VPPRTARLQLADSICLDDVWFRYAGSDDYVLRGIELTIRKGESVAFVGPSGGGKSTLIDVILGILQPECGSVRADGADIREDLAAWQRIVGYVPQSPYLIDGTVRQNIALGLDDRDIDDLAVARVVAAASLEELVNSLAEGLNTNIGERGVRLSGGQRQRIAIARALYDGPQVLVMDEATSALDNLAEQGIMQAASSLKGQRTILLIAHRLSTVRNCDRVVFLCGGTITGVGTYESLLASHEEFRNMVHRS